MLLYTSFEILFREVRKAVILSLNSDCDLTNSFINHNDWNFYTLALKQKLMKRLPSENKEKNLRGAINKKKQFN